MSSVSAARYAGTGLACAVWLSPGALKAEDGERCASAYEGAQEQLQKRRLLEAREQLAVCLAACPEVLSRDCSAWLKEVQAQIPSISVQVRDERGRALQAAEVTVDGRPMALDQTSVELDPGEHRVRVQATSGAVGERRIAVTLADRQRRVVVVARPVSATSMRPGRPASMAHRPRAKEPESAPARTGSYLVGGAGLLMLGVGIGLDAMGYLEAEHLRHTCKPHCSRSKVDAVSRQLLVGDVLAGVGVVSLGIAGWMWLSGSSRPRRSSLELMPSANGVLVSLSSVL